MLVSLDSSRAVLPRLTLVFGDHRVGKVKEELLIKLGLSMDIEEKAIQI